jgi:hypothetical protein
MAGESTVQNDFEHFHRDHMKDIELGVLKVHRNAKTSDQLEIAAMFESFFGADAQKFMAVEETKADPETVLKRAIAKLGDADRLQLLVGNLLEDVKHGRSLRESLDTFTKAGLWPPPKSFVPAADGDGLKGPPAKNDGSFLYNAFSTAKAIGRTLLRLAWNAIRCIPRLVALKPKVTFGFVGPLPTVQIHFEIEPDARTLNELFEVMGHGVRDAWTGDT